MALSYYCLLMMMMQSMMSSEGHGYFRNMSSVVGHDVTSFVASRDANTSVERQRRQALTSMNMEAKLHGDIFRNYLKASRPVRNNKDVVNITTALRPLKINAVKEREQTISVSFSMQLTWTDEFLVWDPANYQDIDEIFVSIAKVWVPDLEVYDSLEGNGNLLSERIKVSINNNGSVTLLSAVHLEVACHMDVLFFPFDDQICKFTVGPWTSGVHLINVVKLTEKVDTTAYEKNTGWKLIDTKLVRNVTKWSCCDHPFADVTTYLHIRRIPSHYTYNLIAPCVLMSILNIFSFYLPVASGEKVTLSLTTFLSFAVFLLLIAESIPATPGAVPLINVFLISVMTLTSLSVCLGVSIIHIHYRGLLHRRAPHWLRSCSVYLDKIVGCCYLRLPICISKKFNAISNSVSRMTATETIQRGLQNHPGSTLHPHTKYICRSSFIPRITYGDMAYQDKLQYTYSDTSRIARSDMTDGAKSDMSKGATSGRTRFVHVDLPLSDVPDAAGQDMTRAGQVNADVWSAAKSNSLEEESIGNGIRVARVDECEEEKINYVNAIYTKKRNFQTNELGTSELTRETRMHDVRKNIARQVERMDHETKLSVWSREWVECAMMAERLLFWMYLLMCVVIYFSILYIWPNYKNMKL